jgi:hypothetical protein
LNAKREKVRPDIVSVHLSPQSKSRLDDVCARRGMSIKVLLGRLIDWFVVLDKTEQSIVLGLVEENDAKRLAELVISRQTNKSPVKRDGTHKPRRRAR